MPRHKPIACRCHHHLNDGPGHICRPAGCDHSQLAGFWFEAERGRVTGVSGVQGVSGTTIGNVKFKGVHGFYRNDADRRFVTEVKAWA
ncbi:hypothetical protein [Allorhodopirellula heiligendammensis]|uniref:Uncharacterized protein n=1 Tax=Allorhodopirellula heiligendammensis TaxID=2714739 RepID=A0A5C6C210_9BACT|nr:hypothetical protein [Allorhodopirellula heiligendammensis]TWU18563.1 hypothetical protein Poly21_07270 [Allorhodopirellula heiligendammensis]